MSQEKNGLQNGHTKMNGVHKDEINSEDEVDKEDEENSDFEEREYAVDSSGFSTEEKLVAAVWVHERDYNSMTWDRITKTFKIRFGKDPPSHSTLRAWERKLFTQGVVDTGPRKRRANRFVYIPYVKASLAAQPEMTLGQRSKLLGIPQTTLQYILTRDLNMVFVPFQSSNPNIQCTTGVWKFREDLQ